VDPVGDCVELVTPEAGRDDESLRTKGQHASDQGEIWARLSLKAAAHAVDSPTGAMSDFYARHAQQMEATRAALAPRPGQVGALVFLGKSWLGLDLLPSPGLFDRAWPACARATPPRSWAAGGAPPRRTRAPCSRRWSKRPWRRRRPLAWGASTG
jgi:hypothetical protein